MVVYMKLLPLRITRPFILTVIVLLLAIILFIMFASPDMIQSRFKPTSQWIPFYASYLGGIFGGIISGALTLGGVYLTIRHQNKLLNQEKVAKMSYIYRRMKTEVEILNLLIEHKHRLSDSEILYEVGLCAERLLGVIADNTKYIMETDFVFITHIDLITDLLQHLINRDLDKSDQQVMQEVEDKNDNIQLIFKIIQKYKTKFY